MMSAHAGVLRTAGGLERAWRYLDAHPACPGPGTSEAGWELANLTHLACAVVAAARRREESRGAHFREDFPEPAEGWRVRQTVVRDASGELRFAQVARSGPAGVPSPPVAATGAA